MNERQINFGRVEQPGSRRNSKLNQVFHRNLLYKNDIVDKKLDAGIPKCSFGEKRVRTPTQQILLALVGKFGES